MYVTQEHTPFILYLTLPLQLFLGARFLFVTFNRLNTGKPIVQFPLRMRDSGQREQQLKLGQLLITSSPYELTSVPKPWTAYQFLVQALSKSHEFVIFTNIIGTEKR